MTFLSTHILSRIPCWLLSTPQHQPSPLDGWPFLSAFFIALALVLVVLRQWRRIKEHIHELGEQKHFTLQILDSAQQGITIIDQERRFIYVNPAFCQILQLPPEEILGKRPADFTSEDDKVHLHLAWKQRLSGRSTTYETMLKRADGSLTPVRITGMPRVEKGRIVGTLAFVMDLSQEETARRGAARFDIIYQTTQALSRTLTLKDVYNSLATWISKSLPCDEFFVSSLDEENRQIQCEFFWLNGKTLDPSSLPPMPLKENGEGIQSAVLISGKPRYIADYSAALKKRVNFYYIDDQGVRHRRNEMPSKDEKTIRSALLVPLVLNEKVVGLIHVGSYQKDAYDHEDLRLLELLAYQVAIARQNALLYEAAKKELAERQQAEIALEKYAQRLRTINEIIIALSLSLSLDEVLQIIIEKIQETVQADDITIFLGEGKNLRIVARLASRPPAVGTLFPKDNPLYKEIVSSQKAIIIHNPLEDPRFANWSQCAQIKTWMGVPLRARKQIIGAMTLDSTREAAYGEEEYHLITALATQAAQAIYNAKLYEESRQRARQLEVLHEIDRTITGSMDLRLSASIILDKTLNEMEMDAGRILLLSQTDTKPEVLAKKGFSNFITLPNFNSLLFDPLVIQQKTEYIANLADASLPSAIKQWAQSEGFTACVCLPLVAKGITQGILELYKRQPFHIDARQERFLDAISLSAAIAIDNMQLFENLQHSHSEVALAYESTLEGWAAALELRDRETQGHSVRVTEMTLKVARAMGLPDDELVHIRRGALLHDIGKMGIPDRILNKPGPLTEEEWKIMREHPVIAYNLLSPIDFLRPALDIPHYHHERWDGSGYPEGRQGTDIPLSARIFAVVDVWDALSVDRSYRRAWTQGKVRAYLKANAGKLFDPQIVSVFLRLIR